MDNLINEIIEKEVVKAVTERETLRTADTATDNVCVEYTIVKDPADRIVLGIATGEDGIKPFARINTKQALSLAESLLRAVRKLNHCRKGIYECD